MEGFCCPEEYDEGPLQLYVTPGVADSAVRFSVSPEHNGPLLFAVGVAGVAGSVSTTGPIMFEEHDETDAMIFVYVPAVSPPIVNIPEPLEVSDCEDCGEPFFVISMV